jgi:hypothetical protein
MPYISRKVRTEKARKLLAKLPDVLGLRPTPVPDDEDEEPYRSDFCPSYDNCINVAALANWPNMSCAECPVDAKYGREFWTYGRREDLERIATDRRETGMQKAAPGSFGLPKPERKKGRKSKGHFILVALAVFCLFGCATVKPTPPTVAPGQKRVEDTPLPPDPETEKLPDGTPKGEWVKPLEKGSCVKADGTPVPHAPQPCPNVSGISMSEEKAARLTLYKIRYPELRLNYKADRQVWKAHRELYETRLKLADEAIQKLQPGWWTRHKFQVGVVGGLILGAAATIAIFEIAQEAK